MKRIPLFIALLVLWSLLSWSVNLEHIVVGAIVSFVVVLLTGGLPEGHDGRIPLIGYMLLLKAVPMLAWDLVKAFSATAYRLLLPSLPANAGTVEIKTKLKSKRGRVVLAATLSFVPGTMMIDIPEDGDSILLHMTDTRQKDALHSAVRKYEDLYGKVFG